MKNLNRSVVGPGSVAPGERGVKRALGKIRPGHSKPRVRYLPLFTLELGMCSQVFRE